MRSDDKSAGTTLRRSGYLAGRRAAGLVLVLGLGLGLGTPSLAAAPLTPVPVPVAAPVVSDVRVVLDCPRRHGLSPLVGWNSGTPYYVASGTIDGLVPGRTYLLDQSRNGQGIQGPAIGAADSTGRLTLDKVRAVRAAVRFGEPLTLKIFDTTDQPTRGHPTFAASVTSKPVESASPLCAQLTTNQVDPRGITPAVSSLSNPSGTHTLVQQSDGNLVLYHSGRALWQTGTYGHPGARTVMQDDGNLVVYSSTGRPLWQSRTYGLPSYLAPARYFVLLQDDGNVVMYGYDDRDRIDQPFRALWQTGTYRR